MENELIKSKLCDVKKMRNAIFFIGIVIFIVGIVYYVSQAMKQYNSDDYQYGFFKYCTGGWVSRDVTIVVILSFVIGIFICILGIIEYRMFSKVSLIVTDKRVYGNAAFGKRVELPLDMISAVGTTVFNGIVVTTSSGAIKFTMIKNSEDIHSAISKLLVERQNKPKEVAQTVVKQEVPQSNADEIKKYKDLLDSGAITQEEFDAKKKQLLGL